LQQLLDIPAFSDAGFTYRGLRREDFSQVKTLLEQLNNGNGLKGRSILYKKGGCKLVVVTETLDQNEFRIVGIDLFYFNWRDLRECTVHEGFIGVSPTYQNQGIATRMRLHAINHFSKCALDGISTRISLNNRSSLKSALNMGFRPIQTYIDDSSGEERHYLIKSFS
jgi:GNAT superfamily N-acetyltransferase